MEDTRVGKGKIPLQSLSVQSGEEDWGGCNFPRDPTAISGCEASLREGNGRCVCRIVLEQLEAEEGGVLQY